MIIKEVQFGSEEQKKAVALREEVLRKPLGMTFSEAELADEFDSFHIATLNEEDDVVACLVLKPLDGGRIKMRQVAVSPAFQGRKLGALIVNFSEVFALGQGFSTMVVHARETAVDFYLKYGYQLVGEPFTEVGLPHRKLVKEL